MKRYTDERTKNSADELWVCEHPQVFTLGQAGRQEHIHNVGNIPIVQSDRGGQVTYHGPGQIVIYTLIDLRRRRLGIRDMVMLVENAVIDVLKTQDVSAKARRDVPGVYVNGAKIAALGLRVRKGCTYHGLALNVDNDLTPYAGIDPCGYQGLEVTSMKKLGCSRPKNAVARDLVEALRHQLGELT